MTAQRPRAQVLRLGSEPRLDDFRAAMADARRRRRRKGLRSAGAGAALAAVVSVAVGLGGSASTNARDEVQLVDVGPPAPSGEAEPPGELERLAAQPGPAAAETAEVPEVGQRAGGTGDLHQPAVRRHPRPRSAAKRTKSTSLIPASCSTQAQWCLTAKTQSRGTGHGHNLVTTMCVRAAQPLGELDFATAQEVDFEILSGSRVIWRWSDGQVFARTTHRLGALANDCYSWTTVWDQYDAWGAKVGVARLTLRTRSLAAQAPAPASIFFMTAAF